MLKESRNNMPKLFRFKQINYFIPESGICIIPNGTPDEIVDLDNASKKDVLKLRKNPNDKKLVDKVKNNLPH